MTAAPALDPASDGDLTRAEVLCAATLLALGLLWLLVARPPAAATIVRLRVEANTASHARLRAVPGIGPVLATRIVQGRPWRDPAQLAAALGARTWARAGPYLCVEPAGLAAPVSAGAARARAPTAPSGCGDSGPGPPSPAGSGTRPR